MKQRNSYMMLAIAMVVIIALSFLVGGMNFYYQKIILNIGIFMILATSLNLINGFTGQFSLGHAGFMAVCILIRCRYHDAPPEVIR
jgi:branched-chain amino acid transport system permease protein